MIQTYWNFTLMLQAANGVVSDCTFPARVNGHLAHGTNRGWFPPRSLLRPHKCIYQLEVFALLMALEQWAPQLQGQMIHLQCDNKAVYHSIKH